MSNAPRPYTTLSPIRAILAERAFQDQKWGKKPHERGMTYAEWSLILGCEVGEAMEAFNEMNWPYIRRPDVSRAEKARNLRSELIQVAAIAVAAVQFLDVMEDANMVDAGLFTEGEIPR